MPAKSLIFALTASLSLHAFVAYSLVHSWAPVRSGFENAYQIAYVHSPPYSNPSGRLRRPPPLRKGRKSLEMTQTTSADLLTDPVKGPIFLDYFSAIRRKIYERVLKKHFQQLKLEGEVTLLFILNSDGKLRGFSVDDKESSADTFTRDLALKALRDAAPFMPFPQALDVKQISFQINVRFAQPGGEGV